MSKSDFDVVVIGSGPNGLSAAIALAERGLSVCILEASARPGGGMRTEELTLPGFKHDVCSAIHPMGALSPYWRTLPLTDHGLVWRYPEVSVAHPLDDQDAVLLSKSLEETAQRLGVDKRSYEKLIRPFLPQGPSLLKDLLAPLKAPRHPILMSRFGLHALRSATGFARARFESEAARAAFAGCAAHSILPLEWSATAALGLIFSMTAHLVDWPTPEGGSESLARALVRYFEALGGEIRLNTRVESLKTIPESQYILFDTSPAQLSSIAGDALPSAYHRRLTKYVYGPGVFKLDWALSESIPWTDKRVSGASTVHLGGTLDEIAAAERAVWRGEHPERPFVLLCQQSEMDPSRAPQGQHTGYAYCHVPPHSTLDLTEVIERQVERFAPGFRETVLSRHSMNTQDFERHNLNYVGGAITGGAATVSQLFTRPVARLNPYSTPNPKLFICSASTPPGGGVHGMCGYYAARSILKRFGLKPPPLASSPQLITHSLP